MKKFLFASALALVTALAFVGCSKDDGKDNPGPQPGPSYQVISFEAGENIKDYLEAPVELGHVDVYSAGAVAYSRDHVFWATHYATAEDDTAQKYWEGPS